MKTLHYSRRDLNPALKLFSGFFMVFGLLMMLAVSGWAGSGWSSNTPVVSLSCTPLSLDEGNSGTQQVSCTVSIDVAPNNKDLKLLIQTFDDTAKTSDNDYVKLDTDFTFAKNTSVLSQNFNITIKGDTIVEADQSFGVKVVNNGTSQQTFTLPSDKTITIVNDDIPLADLSITKTVDNATPTVGDNVTFTIVGKNNGPTTTDIKITDILPTGLTWVSATDNGKSNFDCINSGNAVTCTGSQDFSTNETVTVTIVAKVTNSGTIENNTNIEPTTANVFDTVITANNSAMAAITASALEIVENADDICYGSTDGGCAMFIFACNTSIPINNTGSNDLTNTKVFLDTSGFGSFLNSCSVDNGTANANCTNKSDYTFGPASFFTKGTEYDLGSTMTGSNPDHSVQQSALFNLSSSSVAFYATYSRDGKTYRGQVKACVATAPEPPADETIPTDTTTIITPQCDTFADMFQTRGTCTSAAPGAITFTNGGDLLDGSKNIILNNLDNTVNTCQITVPTWVTSQYETCGAQGDCTATVDAAESLSITYNNPPSVASIGSSPASAGAIDKTISTNTTYTGEDYNTISTSYYTGLNATFNITNYLNINTISTTSDNAFYFQSNAEYALNIGVFGGPSNPYGPQTLQANDGNAKNIKIKTLNLVSGANIDLRAKQTLKGESFTVGRGGSVVNLEAQYININNLVFSNYGSGIANIHIKADYIDIGTLNFGQGSTLTIEPFTPGKNVLFRANNITATSSSTMIVSSGNYYTSSLNIPGTSNASSIIASTSSDIVNLYINGDFSPGNNPAINAPGNSGAGFTTPASLNPANNFMIFINGNLNTGGGGTTLNATIYVEGTATFGNPTYIKGAISAKTISIGQGQFIYDQSIDSSGFGACATTPTIGFDKDTYNISENINLADNVSQAMPVTIILSQASTSDTTVHFQTRDGTAIAGTDYISASGTATILAGETNTTINVYITHDVAVELDESFFIDLTNISPSDGSIEFGINPVEVIILAQTSVQNCYEDTFNSTLDDKWRTLYSSGGYTPAIVGGRLRMTPNLGAIATAVTKDYEFKASENLIIIEFDAFAYSGDGADGFAVVLYDSSIGDSPRPGAFGGSLGYAQKDSSSDAGVATPGFEGGWLGLGLDEYGNYSSPSEGRIGGPGSRNHAVSIRGKGSAQNGYTYLAGTNTLSPVLWKSTTNYTSGRFKMTIDSRDPAHLWITLERDATIDGTYESTIINKFDAISQQGTPPSYVRLAITGSTGASKAIHEIDNLKVDGVCRGYVVGNPMLGALDAWEVGKGLEGVNDDRAITTKIVNKPFNLTLASLNGDSTALEAINAMIIQYQLFDYNTSSQITAFQDLDLTNSTTVGNFNVTSGAFRDVRVRFRYCKETASGTMATLDYCVNNASGYAYDTSIASGDNFAIRPDRFVITVPSGQLKAGVNYNFPSTAAQFGNTIASNNYTFAAANTVLSIQKSNMYEPDGLTVNNSLLGTVAFGSTFDVTNGSAVNGANINFSDVGKVTIQLKDTSWANIDSSDTVGDCTVSGRYVCGDVNATFIPDHFALTNVHLNNNNQGTFTYSSNDLNMSAHLEVTIAAQNALNALTQNFKSGSWENPVNLAINVATTGTPGIIQDDINDGVNLNFALGTLTIPWNETNNTKMLRFNFTRAKDTPINPFIVNGTDVTLTATSDYDGGAVVVTGTSTADQNATFVYGRTNAPKQVFVGTSGVVPIYYEVHCNATDSFGATCDKILLPNGTASTTNDDPRWFSNTLHNPTAAPTHGQVGGITQKNAAGTVSATAATGANPDQSTHTYNATKGYPYKTTMQNAASNWLIYNKYNVNDTNNEFEVEFQSGESGWSGVHENNINTAIGKGAIWTNKRLDW